MNRHKTHWPNYKRKLEDERDVETVQCLSRLVAGISPRSLGFDPRPVHVKLVMYNVAIKQDFLRVRRFPLVSRITAMLRIYSFVTDAI
jgi:hypothetical protein